MKVWNENGNVVTTDEQPIYNDVSKMDILDALPQEFEFPVVVPANELGLKRIVLINARILREPREMLSEQVTQIQSIIDMLNETNTDLSDQAQTQIAALQTLTEHQDWINLTITELQEKDQKLEDMEQNLQQMIVELHNKDRELSDQNTKITNLQASQQAALAQLILVQQQQSQLIEALGTRKYPVTLGDVSVPASALITLQATKKRIINLACAGLKVGDPLTLIPKLISTGYGLVDYERTCTVAGTVAWIDLQCPILSVGGTAQTFSASTLRT